MKLGLALSVAAAAFALTASAASAADDSLNRIKESGVLRLGIANEAPYSFVKADGTMSGVDYEVATAIAKRIGVKEVDGVPMKFGSLIPALKARRIDGIAVGFYIRPARCEQVAFTEPTLAVTDGLLVKAGNPKKIHSYQDLIDQKLILGGNIGAAGPKNAQAVGLPESQIQLFPDWQAAKAALKADRVDAVVMTSISAAFELQIAKDSAIEQAKPFKVGLPGGKQQINHIGYAFHPDDKALFDAFNAELTKFIGSPEHLAIFAKYGLEEKDIPKGVKTADLCTP